MKLPYEVKQNVLRDLDYLRVQSLCDFDRRHSNKKIAERWQGVKFVADKFRFFDRVPRRDLIWPKIMAFCSELPAEFKLMGHEKKLNVIEPTQLFYRLSQEILHKHGLESLEMKFAYVVLVYLSLVADQARMKTETKDCLAMWKWIYPTLLRLGLLEEYRTELTRSKLRLFFQGRF